MYLIVECVVMFLRIFDRYQNIYRFSDLHLL